MLSEWKPFAEKISFTFNRSAEVKALGPKPEKVWFDEQLHMYCQLRERYTEVMEQKCQKLLESPEFGICELETYIEQSKCLGKALEKCVERVRQKLGLMRRVIQLAEQV